MPRLLVCRECMTIEQLPLYDGPPALEASDPILDNLVRRHVQKHGDIKPDNAALLVAGEEKCNCQKCRGSGPTFWEAHRTEVLSGLKERWTGFHPEWYATKDTYREDAMRCFNIHRRPQGTDCIDYRDDGRKLSGRDWPQDKAVYLCDFCPVKTAVDTAIRHAAGMYKRQPGEVD
jgi:hypothetical protein